MNVQNPNAACEHGHQRRKCPYCELSCLLEELLKQRDAALKLADEILIHQVSPLLRDSKWVMGRMDGKRAVANKIRAIFAAKEGK